MNIVGGLVKRAFTLANKAQGLGLTPYELQRKTLRKLVKKAQFTSFGTTFNFTEILDSDDSIRTFQDNVPIYDYDKMHDDWWYRALKNEPNVTWSEKIKYFALSSGTSGAPSKYLPMSEDMIRAIRRAGFKAFFAVTKFGLSGDFFTKQGLFISGTTTLKDNGGYFVGDMSGINLKERPFWLMGFSKPGNKIQSVPDWNGRLNFIARKARTWDIAYISGIPSWVQLMIEKVVEYNKVDNIHEIWPNLRVFVHGGIAFEPHKKAFEALMKKPMVYIDTYLASEGFIAFQNRPNAKGMALIQNNGIFHEFVPFNDQNFTPEGQIIDKPRAYHIGEVKEGVEYALLISTCAGAWRYLIGDTVRFTDAEKKEIVITGRTKHFISVVGEHMSVENMNVAVAYAANKLKTDIKEFVVSPVKTKKGFVHKWYIGAEPLVDAEVFKKLLDEKLSDINDDYATERGNILGEPEVIILPSSIFYDYLKAQGKVGGQAKFPPVLKNEKFTDWEAFVNSITNYELQITDKLIHNL